MADAAFALFMEQTLGTVVLHSKGSRTPVSLEYFTSYPDKLKPLLLEALDPDFDHQAPLLGYGNAARG